MSAALKPLANGDIELYNATQKVATWKPDGSLENEGVVKGSPATQAGELVDYSQVIGVGQTWQEMVIDGTGSDGRSVRVTYTNNTGKPIMVNITKNNDRGSILYVDDVIAGFNDEGVLNFGALVAIVPNDSTYRVNVFTGSITHWLELR